MAVAKENKVVHGNDLTYITQKYKEYFVAKEAGKGLSTNDYTTAEKTKLAGIEAGAQVNDIEVIKVNGTAQTPDVNKAVDITVPTKLSNLTDDIVSGKYLPLSGGDMSSGAFIRLKNANSSMVLQPFGIVKESNEASHVISFPDKQGTVALTSDIPTVAGVYAPLASPSLTGTPTAPTAAAGTNTTQIATTAFVQNAVGNYLPLTGGTLSGNLNVGVDYGVEITQGEDTSGVTVRADGERTTYGLAEIKVDGETITIPQTTGTMALTSDIAASLVSPAFTGTPTAPTASAGTNNTQVATTAFVTNAVTTAIGSVTGISFNTDYATYAALVAAGTAAQGAGVIYLIPNSGSSPNIKDEYVWTGSSYELLGTTEVDLSRFDEDLTATEIEQLLALNS